MNTALRRMAGEPVIIPGPVGSLEGIIDVPASAQVRSFAVLCHPHPLHGGTMTNKVVHMLAKTCTQLGIAAIRFNYRGVGASSGGYGEGDGETQDALAVIDWGRQRWPDARLWLGGFSFGGAVAIRAATQRVADRLVTIAPAVDRIPVETLPQVSWLLVQGDHDEVVDPRHVQDWVNALHSPPDLVMLPGGDHFFHGRMNELRDIVMHWVQEREVTDAT